MYKQIYDSRALLIYLAVKYEGDYEKIVRALQLNEEVPRYEALKLCQSLKCEAITLLDYDYPQRLKNTYRPPIVLFYYGDISLIDDNHEFLGVVGSRDFDEYGKKSAETIISQMIRGRVLVSGLARGIDALGHQCAIDNGGRTIAVLGSGIDYCYPAENQELYEEIKKNHLVISEYPGKTVPNPNQFPMRNRIVVGLSNALFVPQINSLRSGTMISLNIATQLNLSVFVTPWPVGHEVATVNNYLINEGAFAVESGQQILDDLGWSKK